MKKNLFCLLICLCLLTPVIMAQSTQYFRHITMNHMTPRMDLQGLHPISVITAEEVVHYQFTYNEKGKVIEIINSHPSSRGNHPLGDIGAYRVQIEYEDNKEIRTFYDKNGKAVRNMREVAKEVYIYDKDGFKTGLTFYDEQDKAIASNWEVAKYMWTKHEDKVIEKRYNLQNEPQVLAPFFTLGTTAIEYGSTGLVTAQYNVDEQYKSKAHSSGMVSYHDFHDQFGSVVFITYRDINGKLIKAADGEFASIFLPRDQFGNVLESVGIDEKGKEVWHNINAYDTKGNKL